MYHKVYRKAFILSTAQITMANRTNIWNINHNVRKECVICEKEFKAKFSHASRRKCCSVKCRHKWQSIRMTGKNNSNYGNLKENVGYFGLHMWVRKQLGKPSACLFCQTKENLQWANKSGDYKRDLTDWLPLCVKCHSKYDRGTLEALAG